MNVEVVDGAAGAKTDSQDLAASLKQGFAQMSQDIARTIAESFKAFRSEFDLPNEDLAEEELEEILTLSMKSMPSLGSPCKDKTRWRDSTGGGATQLGLKNRLLMKEILRC